LLVSGGVSGSSTANVASLNNFGAVNISTGGTVLSAFQLSDYGSINVAGGTLFTTNFSMSFVTNFHANIQYSVKTSTTGTVLMTSGNIGVTNAAQTGQLLVNVGTFTMNGGNLSADQILVTNGAVSQFSLNGGVVTSSFTQVANGSTFSVGSNAVAAGLVLINDTHSFNNGLQLAVTADSTGTVFFAGTQLQATNGDTVVGLRGFGQLTISNGLVLSRQMIVGATNGATGNYSLIAGTNSVSQSFSAGYGITATGMVRVTGGLLNVTGTNDFTYVGNAGVGQMLISNGAVALANTLYAGSSGKALGTLTMQAGSLVSTNGGAVIGLAGLGQMSVSGGSVTLNVLSIGQATGTGAVLVTGGSLMVTNGSTFVGNFGTGQLTISNTTMQARDVTISSKLGSLGTLTLKSGTLIASNLFNGTNGFINGVGTISGPVTSAGTISPGFSPGRIFITSNLTLQATSTVTMELGGTDTNLYDQIFIGNNLQVDGTLSVSLINAFDPALSNSFHIFDFASSGGQFAVTNLPALDPGLTWDTSNLMTDGDISVIGAVVPEPSTCMLVFGACAGLSLLRRRKKIIPPTIAVAQRPDVHRRARSRSF